MKKYMKLISIALIMVFTISFLATNVFADPSADLISDAVDGYTAGTDAAGTDSAKSIVGAIIQVVRIVAVGVAVIMLLVLAMKYMTASPEGKAEVKKTAIQYVIGAVVLFATSGILTLISQVASNI